MIYAKFRLLELGLNLGWLHILKLTLLGPFSFLVDIVSLIMHFCFEILIFFQKIANLSFFSVA